MLTKADESSDEDQEFLSIKRRIANTVTEGTAEDSKRKKGSSDINGPRKVVIDGPDGPVELIIDSKKKERMLKSKKAMLKFKGKGKKLVYDDEGNAHAAMDLEDENEFNAAGPASVQRNKFLEEQAAKVRMADEEDKVVAREKKKVKREKRKQALRQEDNEHVSEGGLYGLPMVPYVDYGRGSEDEAASGYGEHGENMNGSARSREPGQALEDLEAVAAELLG